MLARLANVRKDPPQIIQVNEPINVIGVSIRTNERTIYQDAQQLGKRYQEIKNSGIIPAKKVPWAFAAVSKDFSEDGSWEYLMGDVVTSLNDIPEGLIGFVIPTGLYARFTLQPRWLWIWGLAMGLMKRFIYAEWLPASQYEPNNHQVGDFEWHDQRSLEKHPQIELYVSIREKQAVA